MKITARTRKNCKRKRADNIEKLLNDMPYETICRIKELLDG